MRFKCNCCIKLFGYYWLGKYFRQPHRRCTRFARAHENDPLLDVRLTHYSHSYLSRRTQRTLDLLYFRRRARRHLASHSPSHSRPNRQTIRRPLPRYTVWFNFIKSSNRRIFRGMARRHRSHGNR